MKILCFLFLVSFISFHTTVKAGSHEHHENDDTASNRFRKPAQNPKAFHLFSPHQNFITPRHTQRRYALQPIPLFNERGTRFKPLTSEKKRKEIVRAQIEEVKLHEEKKRAILREQIKKAKLHEEKKSTTFEEQTERAKPHLTIRTPPRKISNGFLKPEDSMCVVVYSPKNNERALFSEIVVSLEKVINAAFPTQTLKLDARSNATRSTREEKFYEISIRESEEAAVKRSNFPLDISQILSHENQLLEHLKSKIHNLKSNFYKAPNLASLSRKLLAKQAYRTIALSKGMGFSRTVFIRDRRLTYANGVSLKRLVIENDDIIDPNLVDKKGKTNVRRMSEGLAPIGPDKQSINLHHILQSDHHAIMELTSHAHQQAGKLQLHYKRGLPEFGKSEVNRNAFRTFREDHWKL